MVDLLDVKSFLFGDLYEVNNIRFIRIALKVRSTKFFNQIK